jgi:hypothetical protein
MHHLAPFVALFLVAAGCTATRSIPSLSDVVYDNRGGLAYGGLRITFRASGTYEMQQYTDVVGRDTVVERGTYERQESAYVLSHEGAQSVYHIITVRGVEYLLDSRTFVDYSRTRDRERLHAALRLRPADH